MEEDDSMEIDETIRTTPIIERRSEEYNLTNNSLLEKDSTYSIQTSDATPEISSSKTSDKVVDNRFKEPERKKTSEKVDVVILDDDDDEEPMKKPEGN